MVADKVLRRPGDGTTLVEAMEAGLAAVCHSNWQVGTCKVAHRWDQEQYRPGVA
jgi:hypothetical protein